MEEFPSSEAVSCSAGQDIPFFMEPNVSLLCKILGLQPRVYAGYSFSDFLPWRWRRYVHPKRPFTQDIQGATS
jgi:hypothetical protein